MSRKDILESFIFTNHFIERCLERDIDVEAINSAIKFGKLRFSENNCCKFITYDVCVVMNTKDKTYVTAYNLGDSK